MRAWALPGGNRDDLAASGTTCKGGPCAAYPERVPVSQTLQFRRLARGRRHSKSLPGAGGGLDTAAKAPANRCPPMASVADLPRRLTSETCRLASQTSTLLMPEMASEAMAASSLSNLSVQYVMKDVHFAIIFSFVYRSMFTSMLLASPFIRMQPPMNSSSSISFDPSTSSSMKRARACETSSSRAWKYALTRSFLKCVSNSSSVSMPDRSLSAS
mmetsp:Transcript_100570/g.313486  ORF Transcript_100570/g.313486 Transcript_100570/m.313486 type:complete len:215 (+) Transcript_100570:323-967(+)